MKPDIYYEDEEECINSMETMIVICDDYDEAQWAYNVFLEFLAFTEKEEPLEANDCCCEVITDQDIRFVFMDLHYLNSVKFDDNVTVIIGVWEFLSDMDTDDPIYVSRVPYRERR